jgi:hypothetical protein
MSTLTPVNTNKSLPVTPEVWFDGFAALFSLKEDVWAPASQNIVQSSKEAAVSAPPLWAIFWPNKLKILFFCHCSL